MSLHTANIHCSLQYIMVLDFIVPFLFAAVLLCVQQRSWHLVTVPSSLEKLILKSLLVQWTQNIHTWHGKHVFITLVVDLSYIYHIGLYTYIII